jgi:charged multivesicular body protein 2A
MGAVFGKEKPLKEVIRENQRMLKKAIRELEKVVRDMQTEEKKLISSIQKAAKQGQMVRAASVSTSACNKELKN